MKFSIITPSYNQLDWLKLCIASVRDQICVGTTRNDAAKTNFSIEHIVQDCETSGIAELAAEMGAILYRNGVLEFSPPTQNPDYSLIIHIEKDAGMYDAINRGLAKSNGEICSWLNCDEQYLPGVLQKMTQFFVTHEKVEAVFGDTILINETLIPCAYRKAILPSPKYSQAFQMNLHSSSLFFRRPIIDVHGLLPTRYKSISDAVWIVSLQNKGIRFATYSAPLSAFILAASNLSISKLSQGERQNWAQEIRLGSLQRFAIRLRNLLSRLLGGAYLPRKTDVMLVRPDSAGKRCASGSRWLDFRFVAGSRQP